MKAIVISILISLLSSPNLLACEYGDHSDLKAVSNNKRYTATVDYGKDGSKRYIEQPVISLIDNHTKSILWSVPFPKETSVFRPYNVLVTNAGYILAWGIDDYYTFNKSGQYRYVFNLTNELHRLNEKKVFCNLTTLDWVCNQFSTAKYFSFENKEYYYLSLYWGRVFVIDIENSKLSIQGNVLKAADREIIYSTKIAIQKYSNNYIGTYEINGNRYFYKQLYPFVFTSKKYHIEEGTELIETFITFTSTKNNSARKKFDKIYKNR
jgi:hypothetical protein